VLATDVDWYARETRGIFELHEAFEAKPEERNAARDYVTKYERKWRSMGRDIFELRARKKMDNAALPAKEDDDEPMEDIEIPVSETWGDFREKVSELCGDTLEGAGFLAVFREVFWNGNAALVKIVSVDEGFEQHYYLKIIGHKGKLRIRPDSVGHPYKTPAVRACVRHTAKKLALFAGSL
jgi:tRNA (guanine-N7-)-methyltransferase